MDEQKREITQSVIWIVKNVMKAMTASTLKETQDSLYGVMFFAGTILNTIEKTNDKKEN